jgi:hypothetical protein
LASHIRSALAPVYDFRMPIDRVRDRIADHADFVQAASFDDFMLARRHNHPSRLWRETCSGPPSMPQ